MQKQNVCADKVEEKRNGDENTESGIRYKSYEHELGKHLEWDRVLCVLNSDWGGIDSDVKAARHDDSCIMHLWRLIQKCRWRERAGCLRRHKWNGGLCVRRLFLQSAKESGRRRFGVWFLHIGGYEVQDKSARRPDEAKSPWSRALLIAYDRPLVQNAVISIS